MESILFALGVVLFYLLIVMDLRKSIPYIKKYLVIILVNVLVFFVLLEVVLRFVPSKFTELKSNYQYQSDSLVGYLPLPGNDSVYNIFCLQNPHVIINSAGFRGKEWKGEKDTKIALLGDSFLHGLTIPDKMHVATLLESFTGGEIWNGGISGYGTYQEFLLWKSRMKALKPDITIVFFNSENDVRDNQCTLCRSEGQIYSPCCEVKKGEIQMKNDFQIRKPDLSKRQKWLRKYCFTYRLAKNLMNYQQYYPTPGNMFLKESFAYNVYCPGSSQAWEEGWQITEWALRSLKKECDETGSKLLVVNVPGILPSAKNWQAELKSQIGIDTAPKNFDLNYPAERIRTITQSAAIPYLDLLPSFIEYRDKHRMESPLFAWCCDFHWNPVGHRLSGEVIYEHLLKSGWIDGQPRPLTPAPMEVLGKTLHDEIYGCKRIRF